MIFGGKKSFPLGFTVLELVLVFAIVGVLAGIGIPIGIDGYRSYLLTAETKNAIAFLRRTQNLALTNRNQSSFGLSILSNQYVLFQGASYASRNPAYDEAYPRGSNITITGSTTEIVFEALSGKSNVSTTMTFSNGYNVQTIGINNQGTIFW